MIRLAQEREITPYVCVHPDEDDRLFRKIHSIGNAALIAINRRVSQSQSLVVIDLLAQLSLGVKPAGAKPRQNGATGGHASGLG